MTSRTACGLLVLALLTLTAVVTAQTNGACPAAVQQAYGVAGSACDQVAYGEACLGNGMVTFTDTAGNATDFVSSGDRFELAGFERLQTRSMIANPQTWTTLVARLEVTDDGGARDFIDALAIGDVVVWRAQDDGPAVVPSGGLWPATVAAAAGVIVRRDANAGSDNIWQLRDGDAVQAIGRSADGLWIRILIPSPNGGAGWVFGRFLAVDGGSGVLPYHTNFSPLPVAGPSASGQPGPLQRLRMESLPVSDDCPLATDSGLLLQSAAQGENCCTANQRRDAAFGRHSFRHCADRRQYDSR